MSNAVHEPTCYCDECCNVLTEMPTPNHGLGAARHNETKFDIVSKAEHYNKHPSGVECIDVIEHMCCNIANVWKYTWRAGLKDAHVEGKLLQDLKKAQYYMNREVARIEKQLAK